MDNSWSTLAIETVVTLTVCWLPFVFIFQKTGRSGWWALLLLIPMVGFAVLWFLALGRWPALDRLKNSS